MIWYVYDYEKYILVLAVLIFNCEFITIIRFIYYTYIMYYKNTKIVMKQPMHHA